MLSKVSAKARSISPSGIRKFFDLVKGMSNVISLGVGEPDFVTPWRMRESGIHALETGKTMYTSNWGLIELRREISKYLKNLYGVHYNPETEILITVGVSEALDLAVRAITDPGDEIILHEPCYVSYVPVITLAGGSPVKIPTFCKNGFKLTPSTVKKAITRRTKALILNFPNNPTGATMNRKDLEAVGKVVEDHDILVISDEIYDRLTYKGKHTCFSSLPSMKKRTILLNGFSKAFAMTGWRLGYAAANSHIIEAMLKIHQYTMLCAPTGAQHAAIEALAQGGEETKKMIEEYDRRRKVFVKGLNEIGLLCMNPKGAFYAFPSIRGTGISSGEFSERLLKEERVAVVPGSVFGECGEGFVRCAYAAKMEDLEEALVRMKRFVKSIRKK